MIVAVIALRAVNLIGRAAVELAALGLFVGMIALWSAIAAGA